MMRLAQTVLALVLTQAFSLPTSDALSLVQQSPAARAAVFAEGDHVELSVQMKGGKDAAWIPATIVKLRFKGFYDVGVELGPDGRHSLRIPGMAAGVLRKPLKDADWEESSRHYAQSPSEARQVIEQIDADIRRRARASLSARGLTKFQVEKKMVDWERTKKAKQEQDARSRGCPKGYRAVDGDGKGADQFGRESNVKRDTIDLCMADCEERRSCLSFEWSPNTKVCNLNKAKEPFRKQNFMDFIYCQRLSKTVAPHGQQA